MTTFTLDQVQDALNSACNAIDDAANLPDAGVIDALNLLVNATMQHLEHPGRSLEDVVAASYSDDTTLGDVLDWIGG